LRRIDRSAAFDDLNSGQHGITVQDLHACAPALQAEMLRGENPGEIPIYGSVRFYLAINLKTAKALDLLIPASLVARADVVIE
jgi:putative tryptophan/tyrosine transport system substrate-binding protein